MYPLLCGDRILKLCKGWKKPPNSQQKSTQDKEEKRKEEYESKAGTIRRELSIAKVELDRLRENRKITKRGRNNSKILQKECNSISLPSLVAYIEKKKSKLRKLKTRFYTRKKTGGVKKNQQTIPTLPWACLSDMASRNTDDTLPKFQRKSTTNNETEEDVFENIGQASSFWRDLWEQKGTGNSNADWLKEIKRAINDQVPHPVEDKVILTVSQVKDVYRSCKRREIGAHLDQTGW